MNILITGVGGPTPRSFAKALQYYSNFKPYRLVATDINPLSIGLYQRNLFDQSYVIPRATSPDYWDTIQKIVDKEQIDMAVILPEQEVVEWSRRNALMGLPCKALLPDLDLAETLVDKARMTSILAETGLVPDSVQFGRNDCVTGLMRHFYGPFWVRSSLGSCGLGSLLVHSKEHLRNWIDINPHVEMFLASTYLPGRNLACKMLYYDGELIRSACAERVEYVMAKVAPSGITGNTSFGRLLNDPKMTEVAAEALDRLFRHTGSKRHGFFTVDMKEDEEGRPLITEINIRHVAFTQCFAAGGANFAEDTVRLLDEDSLFDRDFQCYEFEKDLIFLRDVDENPILMKESDLLRKRVPVQTA